MVVGPKPEDHFKPNKEEFNWALSLGLIPTVESRESNTLNNHLQTSR